MQLPELRDSDDIDTVKDASPYSQVTQFPSESATIRSPWPCGACMCAVTFSHVHASISRWRFGLCMCPPTSLTDGTARRRGHGPSCQSKAMRRSCMHVRSLKIRAAWCSVCVLCMHCAHAGMHGERCVHALAASDCTIGLEEKWWLKFTVLLSLKIDSATVLIYVWNAFEWTWTWLCILVIVHVPSSCVHCPLSVHGLSAHKHDHGNAVTCHGKVVIFVISHTTISFAILYEKI